MMDKNEVLAIGTGSVKLEAFINEAWVNCTLYDVLYIPGAVNLFSEPVIAQKGYLIIRDKELTVFYKHGKERGPQAVYKNGLYLMQFRAAPQQEATALIANRAKLWHDRLSHINIRSLRETIKKNAPTGVRLEDLSGDFACQPCHLGKETRKPFPSKTKPDKPEKEDDKTKPGEVIHCDLSGKMPISSIGGANYFMVLKDDASGFRAVYFLKSKDETAACIKLF
jgi:hypothetical protein